MQVNAYEVRAYGLPREYFDDKATALDYAHSLADGIAWQLHAYVVLDLHPGQHDDGRTIMTRILMESGVA